MALARAALRTNASTFVLCQLAGLVGTIGLVALLGKPQAVWLTFPALFMASYLWSKNRGVKLSREQAKSLSLASGLVFGGLAALSFVLVVLSSPEAFDIPTSALPWLAIFIGAGGGFGSLVLSLCALDTTGLE